MASAAASGIAYEMFLHNIRTSAVDHMVDHRRGFSRNVLPTLKERSFHLIYLDGSHFYDDLFIDGIWAQRLIREDGIICGDDWELKRAQVDPVAHQKALQERRDCVQDPRTGEHYHPGVTEALHEVFPRASNYEGFWAVQNQKGQFNSVSLPMGSAGEIVIDLKR